MKKILFIFSVLYITSCISQTTTNKFQQQQIIYNIDVTDLETDLFDVTVTVSNLTAENNIYNFVATAPGTYENMNFGRFVKTFTAYDDDEDELLVERISENRWKIKNIEELSEIRYEIEDTFDSEIENQPMPMCGSGIDSNFVAINTFAVLGYFEGLQSYPSKLTLEYNSDWTIGTALRRDENEDYYAETYDRLADSPILLGDLTTAFTKVDDIDVEIYLFAPDTALTAQKILVLANEVLQSSQDFITYSPVDRYTFLMLLLDWQYYQQIGLIGGGALEHSYSSLYVEYMSLDRLSELRSTMAHEFMHILSPLNLSSEIIHTYNFETPIASQHIWLYEGVTEWVSEIMQLRSGIITPEQYLDDFSKKLRISDMYDPNISLTDMSLGVYTDSIQNQFINFYNRGAITATLLDLRILELSGGTKGWREVYLDLLLKYGKDKPFPEKGFFDIIVELTYPEIEQFIDNYIRGFKPLPYAEYMNKLGYVYVDEIDSDDNRPTIGANVTVNKKEEIILRGINDEAKKYGLKENDVLVEVLGEEVSLETAYEIVNKLSKMSIGDQYDLVVKRNGKEITISGILQKRKTRHIFREEENPTKEQLQFRTVWMQNLKRS